MGGQVRQYFKFQVQKPLSVTTKLHVMRDAVFLENQIQNQTRAPLLLAGPVPSPFFPDAFPPSLPPRLLRKGREGS